MPRLSISLDIAANPLSFLYGTTAIYVASGLLPEFIADFSREFYKTNSGIKTFANAITHTRAGNATMVDSDGVLKWGPHNIIPDSEGMTGWSDVNTATSSAADGVLTISLPAEGDYASESIIITVQTGSTWTAKLEIKGPVGEDVTVRLARTGVNTYEQNAVAVVFTGDWQTVSVSHTFAATHTGLRLDIVRLAGQGAGPVYARKASIYRSDLGGMVDNPDQSAGFETYVPTTSAARYLPRRGHHVYNGSAWVTEGLLHESEARTNLLTYSEDLSNAA